MSTIHTPSHQHHLPESQIFDYEKHTFYDKSKPILWNINLRNYATFFLSVFFLPTFRVVEESGTGFGMLRFTVTTLLNTTISFGLIVFF